MTTTRQAEFRAIMNQNAREEGLEALQRMKTALESAMRDMDRLVASYEQATTDDKRIDVLSSAVGQVVQFTANTNPSMALRAATKIAGSQPV